jgi:alpha-tubulin suppressor-like RCC1 family protein
MSSTISNVLLIDTSISDYTIFETSVNADTAPILYSRSTTRAELLASLSAYTSIDRIGIAFANSANILFLEEQPFFDSTPCSDNMNFMISIIQQWNVKHIDYLACSTLNVPEWANYYASLLEQTGVIVGASNDNTGNIVYGGDWVLESTGQDIEMIYFTENIEYYTYLLDSNKSNFSVMIKQDNTIYFTGDNANQNTQIGDATLIKSLIKVVGIDGLTITQIYPGYETVAILMNNGDVYLTGRNNSGQSGFQDLQQHGRFTKIINNTGKTPKAVACGNSNTYLLMNDASGSIYGVGVNGTGSLGIGTTDALTHTTLELMQNTTGKIPVSIESGFVSGGANASVIITMGDGSLYGVGVNARNMFGPGGNALTMTLIAPPINLPANAKPIQTSMGRDFFIVLMDDISGSMYGIGLNANGQMAGVASGQYDSFQLIQNTTGLKPVAISVGIGNYYMIVLMNNGTIYGTGVNTSGNLGIANGNITNQTTLQPMQMPVGLKATSIYAGGSGPIVLMDNGTVYGCGDNTYGQLGLGDYATPKTTLQLMPMPTGLTPVGIYSSFRTSYVLMNDGSVYGTGNNNVGQVGMGTTYNFYVGFKQITPFTYLPVMVEYGTGHMIVLTTTGAIYGNGLNANGQLGLGNTTTPTTLLSLMQNTTGLTPIAIACGASHTVVLMSDSAGSIYGTGLNSNGQLGISSGNVTQQTSLAAGSKMQSVATKIPKAINCGTAYTIVLMTDNTIYGTGLNTNGQLGISTGNVTQQTTLQLMQSVATKIPIEVACGTSHTIVLMSDGSVYGTGLNSNGQLGIATGNVTQQTTLQLMQSVPNKTAKDIACGASHTIVLMNDNTIYGTGLNTNGQLGIATGNVTQQTTLQLMEQIPSKTPVAISCGVAITFVLMSDGSLYGIGLDTTGQLGKGYGSGPYQAQYTTLTEITSISSVRRLPSSAIYLNSPSPPAPCFKEGTLILTDKGYVPIENLRNGDRVKTLHDYKAIHMIGKQTIYNVATPYRIKDQLYVCTNEHYPEVFEPLVITGCHSILMDEYLNERQQELVLHLHGGVYITENQYRVPACVDERAQVYDKKGQHVVYHISLENDDYFMNYGIYANGLLVETCSKRYLAELSNMEIIE